MKPIEFVSLPPTPPESFILDVHCHPRIGSVIVRYPIAILGPRRAAALRRRWAQDDAMEFGYLDIGGEG